jgi:ankyrin repeat protein
MSFAIGRHLALRAVPAFATQLATTVGNASKFSSNFTEKMHFHRLVKTPNYSGFSSLLYADSSLLKTAKVGHRSFSTDSNFRIFGINKFIDGNNTALMIAVKKHVKGHERLEVCKSLLASGADPNIPDALGRTPLDIATAGNDTELVKLLKENGAKRSIISLYAGHDHIEH